jgi:outer membrane protein
MFRILAVIYTFFWISNLFSQNAYTVSSAIQYALAHNYDYRKAQLDKMITYERTQEVLTQGFPKISANIGYQNQFIVPTSIIPGDAFGNPGTLLPVKFGLSNSMTATIGLQQLIFDGRYLVGVQARSAIKELANIQVKMSERDVRILIAKTYYQAVIAQKSIKLLKENSEILHKLYDQTKKTYQAGLIEELDVERLQYNVQTLDNTIRQLESQSQLALSALKLNMGYPMDDTLIIQSDLQSELTRIKNQNFFQDSLENRVELKLVNQGIQIKKYDLKQLKYGYLPSVYGSAAFGYNSFSQRFSFPDNPWYPLGNFGIQAQIPIFDGFTRKSQVQQAKLALEKSELDRNQLYQALRMESMNSIRELRNSINDYDNQMDIWKLSEKIERKTQVKYKEGVGSSFEFANAQNERIQQYLKLLQSELKLLNSNVDFQKSNGKL